MHLLLLLIWVAIAGVLRLTHLATKPLWADEFSTLVFSLGNSFLTVPLDRALSLTELLQPLQPQPQATIGSVMQHLLTESNHPPLFFVLMHLWLKLFPVEAGFVSLWAARAFSVLWGVVAVPAAFGLGWLTCRSRLVGQLAAALMAVSPFGVYLAQEARHYTLAILWIMASLGCLVLAARQIFAGQRLTIGLCLAWVAVNGLGIATHYFVLLTLLAEAIALVVLIKLNDRGVAPTPVSAAFGRLAVVAAGTVATAAVWLPALQTSRSAELTRWIRSNEFDHSNLVDQIGRFGAGLVTMIYLPPVQGVPLPVSILSSILVVVLLLWTLPLLGHGLMRQSRLSNQIEIRVLVSFVVAAIGLTLLLTLGGVNFASVFRYQFFYFPAVVVLIAIALSDYWQRTARLFPTVGLFPAIKLFPAVKALPVSLTRIRLWQIGGRRAIGLVLGCCLLGSLTVAFDFGYQKIHRPDVVAAAIDRSLAAPALVAMPHKTHGHTGRLMGIAWELRRLNLAHASHTSFLLADYPQRDLKPAIAALERTLATLPRPIDVWRINFRSEANPLSHQVLVQQGCTAAAKLLSVDGYRYQPYECRKKSGVVPSRMN